MTERSRPCAGDDALAADLALGLLTGRERADALQHVFACGACRARVDELRDAADSLLLVGPRAEPPAGFESGVLARIAEERGHRGRGRPAGGLRWRRPLALAAALMVVAALGTAMLLGRTPASGDKVAEAAMVAPSGRDVGQVWRYDGDPSWLFVSVPGWSRWESPSSDGGDYRLRVVLTSGRTIDLHGVSLDGTDGSWGTTTKFDVTAMESVSVVDGSGRVWCTGRFA